MQASIIIRAYNAETTIARALKSALTQDFSGTCEVIVVDDGSTDGTASIVEEYARDLRVRLVQQENRGIVEAANAGLKLASGELVHFLDADDELVPNALTAPAGAMADESSEYAYGDYLEEYQGESKHLRPEDPFKAPIGAFMWRRRSLQDVGCFQGDTIFPEYEVLLRTWGMWHGMYIPQTIFIYHRSASSLTGSNQRVKNALDALRAMYPDRIAEIERIRSYML